MDTSAFVSFRLIDCQRRSGVKIASLVAEVSELDSLTLC